MTPSGTANRTKKFMLRTEECAYHLQVHVLKTLSTSTREHLKKGRSDADVIIEKAYKIKKRRKSQPSKGLG